jgi:hypothetical protein
MCTWGWQRWCSASVSEAGYCGHCNCLSWDISHSIWKSWVYKNRGHVASLPLHQLPHAYLGCKNIVTNMNRSTRSNTLRVWTRYLLRTFRVYHWTYMPTLRA